MRFKKWNINKAREEMMKGLSVFLIRQIAEDYGTDVTNEFVKKVYEEAERVYGSDFITDKKATYTEFKGRYKIPA